MGNLLEKTMLSQGIELKLGDTAEIIEHPFLHDYLWNVQGKVIELKENQVHSFGCVDNRGEKDNSTFVIVALVTNDNQTHFLNKDFVRKVS